MGASSIGCRLAVAGLLGLACMPAPAGAQTVGTTGAVNPASTGTEPGGGERTLKIGSSVVFKERIRTTGAGSLQVLFVDTTTLSIGPNSDMTIDEFVYNPNAGSGKFVASLSKGALRFVGGQISHKQGATIETPSATIGIRGGGAFIEVKGKKVVVICTLGQCEIDAPSGMIDLRPGQGAKVGEGSSQRFDPSTKLIRDFQQSLTTGHPGPTGNDGFVLTEGNPKNPGSPQDPQTSSTHTIPIDDPNNKGSIEQQDLIDDALTQTRGFGTQDGEPSSPTEPNPPFPPNPP